MWQSWQLGELTQFVTRGELIRRQSWLLREFTQLVTRDELIRWQSLLLNELIQLVTRGECISCELTTGWVDSVGNKGWVYYVAELTTGPGTGWVDSVGNKSRVATRQGKVRKLKFFQGQGIVREFCNLSGKIGNIVKCQGIVREFWKYKIQVPLEVKLASLINELGQNPEVYSTLCRLNSCMDLKFWLLCKKNG